MSDYEVPEVVDVHEPNRGRGDAIDLDNRLRQLERMVSEAKIVPLSSSIMLNRAEVDGIIDDLRHAMPEELRQARWVVKEREEVLESAHAESQRIIDEARSERARLISRTEVVEAANREAARIVEDAQERARQMRLDADDYVDGKLANFEIVLNKTLQAVDRGREKLRGRLHGDELVEDLNAHDEGGL
ncbi:ATP synthase F0 subunit B [Salsipaludibacter albus]|uniref:ATP synthase F0 subunit B n=1 Tax=Salsipaludibacter albus TaxID=2849650 RepID=UPI001EE3B6AA|nr:ATP synthase F0 subunit B [Salsipaludibacter albus]MBY5162395.1 ATP synthase F0 subunit B [Salsipaludibacter albus]